MAYFWQQGPNCWGDWVSEMIHCYWLAHQQQCKSEEKERETLSDIWVSHHRQCSHLCGAEGVGSKNQPWANSAWPPQWLPWQDYAILQANPFSATVPAPHLMEDLVRIGLTLGKCVGLQHRQNLAAVPIQHRQGGALMSGSIDDLSSIFLRIFFKLGLMQFHMEQSNCSNRMKKVTLHSGKIRWIKILIPSVWSNRWIVCKHLFQTLTGKLSSWV